MKCLSCREKEGIIEKEVVIWNSITQVIRIHGIHQNLNYILITNLIDAIITDPFVSDEPCGSCPLLLKCLDFKIFIKNSSAQSELADFKYCVLVIDKLSGVYCKMLGTIEMEQYIKGNLVAKHIQMASEKKKPPMNKQTNCIILNNDPVKQKVNLLRKSKSNQDLKLPRGFSIIQEIPKQQKLSEYYLFVIKLQKEVENLYRSQMLHQYVWQQEQIQYIMEQVSLSFGQYQGFLNKRRYLKFTFKRKLTDQAFHSKWKRSDRQIVLRKDKIIQGKIINYYIFSKKQILPNQYLTNKLFLLPNISSIIDLCLIDPWVIVAAVDYVLFIHAYQPMDFFKHEDKMNPTKIVIHPKQANLVFILNKDGFYGYRLHSNRVQLESIYFTQFLQPHAVQIMGNSLIVAGIDCLVKEDRRTIQNKRMIYSISNHVRKQEREKPARTLIQYSFQVAVLSEENKYAAISNIIVLTEREIIACSLCHKFYLFNKKGQKLIQVQLKDIIKKASFLPFLFNMVNFFVITANGEAIRVGVECYGQTLGAQLQRLKIDEVKDGCLSIKEGVKWEMLICRNRQINQFNYLKDQSRLMIREDKGNLVAISSDKIGVAYIVDLQHSYELKYMEI